MNTHIKPSDIYTSYMYSYPHKTAYRELSGLHFAAYKQQFEKSGATLYFHIPFCKSKCGYCNLFSVTGQDGEYMQKYISACEDQLGQYGVPLSSFDYACFGGGDPLSLPRGLLDRLLALGGGLEKHIEVSPNETSFQKLDILESHNTKRISIGIQSFVDTELLALQRAHSATSALNALELIMERDFPCVNLDLIYGIPGQTLQSFEASLKRACEFGTEELFIYPLYARSGTPLEGTCTNPLAYSMYWHARDYLLANGFAQVSMRQFARKPTAVQKNCGFENMLAIGCGGRSYLGNLHFCSPYATDKVVCLQIINEFIASLDKTCISNGYVLSKDEMERRYVVKNLLHCAGVNIDEYKSAFGSSIFDDFPVLGQLLSSVFAQEVDGIVALTPVGLSLSDYIGTFFISTAVKERMEQWSE